MSPPGPARCEIRARIAACLLYLALWLPLPAALATQPPLIFGVFPNMTAKQTVETYRPMAAALEKALGRPVVVYSARDFRTFVERTRHGEYDILLTAPHLAWLARQDVGYRPLLKYATPTRGLLVVKAASGYLEPDALRGRILATADPIAVAVMAVQAELAAYGLQAETDYRTNDAGTHFNAVMQVINGRADAAMLGMHPYLLLPPDIRTKLHVLVETPPLSSLMYLTHPRIRDRDAAAIRKALLAFAQTRGGRAFMERGGYGGFVAVDGSELRAFRPYAMRAQDMLRTTR